MNMRNKRQLVVVVTMMWMALAAQGANRYWKENSGDGVWSDAANWDVLPTSVDRAYFNKLQTDPFTVNFTADASAGLLLGCGDAAKPVKVAFNLNGHTFTHTGKNLLAHCAVEWTIKNGTLWTPPTTSTSFIMGYSPMAYTSKVIIGVGATYLFSGPGIFQVGSQSASELVIQDGGKLITEGSNTRREVGTGATGDWPAGTPKDLEYTARITVTDNGSVWSNLVGNITLSSHARATAELNITNNALLVHTGKEFCIADAPGANASLNIASGGVLDARLASNSMRIGYNGTGTVTVTGSGSKLLTPTNQVLYLGNTDNASQGTLIIENKGLVEKMYGNNTISLGAADNTTGRLIVRDGGLLRWAGGYATVYVGGSGLAEGSTGELIVTGATSRAIFGGLSIATTCGNGLVTVAGGGTIECFRPMYVGRFSTNSVQSYNGSAKLVVTGTGSVLKKTALTTIDLPGAKLMSVSLGVGGCAFTGWNNSGMKYYSEGSIGHGPGGKGLATIENGGRVEIDGYFAVYSNSTLRIDGGRTHSGQIGLETNAVLNAVLRQSDANDIALMTANGEARIWGATLVIERGTDFTPIPGDVYTLITSGSLNENIKRFSYNGATLQDGDLIEVGGTTFKVGYTATDVTLTVRCVGTLITIL